MQPIKFIRTMAVAVLASLAVPGAPARAEADHVESGGVRIAYEVVGQGEPLVLIPGLSQSRQAWKDAGFVDAFASRGRQLILIDPRGHGDSGKPHEPADYSPDLVSADVIAVLDALGIGQADLLGYSRGGAIAIFAAVHHPDRVRSVIAGGIHPYAEDISLFREAIAPGLDRWVELIEQNAGALPEKARDMFLRNDVAALRAAVAADRPDLSEELAESKVPVLFYAGSEDPRFEAAQRFAAQHGARFVPLEGLNHFQTFFSVEPVVDAVQEFLPAARKRAGQANCSSCP